MKGKKEIKITVDEKGLLQVAHTPDLSHFEMTGIIATVAEKLQYKRRLEVEEQLFEAKNPKKS